MGWVLNVGLRGCIHRSGQAREEGKPLGNRAAHPQGSRTGAAPEAMRKVMGPWDVPMDMAWAGVSQAGDTVSHWARGSVDRAGQAWSHPSMKSRG